MKILAIDPTSPLAGRIQPEYELVAVNDQPVADNLDFHYRASEETVRLTFRSPEGVESSFELEDFPPEELGLTFQDDRIMVCRCKCIFCFVRQQPKGMRHPLYIKDEDFRLSFTHGNFITMSNLDEAEQTRIIEQRMSPMYISVHATDDELRRHMLGNANLAPIMAQLRRLADGGIKLHTQVVLCPEINDGDYLHRTITDLHGLRNAVESLAVVPVGLTRYRNKLAKLRCYTRSEAAAIIDTVEQYQVRFLEESGSRFVWAADEFYIQAGIRVPRIATYEAMAQFENGVGMVRQAITHFNRRKRYLRNLRSGRSVAWFTGRSAEGFLNETVVPFVRDEAGLNLALAPVDNRFWGHTVTVSGLLTGKDLLEAALERRSEYDLAVLPPNCLNADDLFLDDMPLSHFKNELGCPVLLGNYNLATTVREAFA